MLCAYPGCGNDKANGRLCSKHHTQRYLHNRGLDARTRVPWAPLVRWLAANDHDTSTEAAISRAINVDDAVTKRWHRIGIKVYQADRIAIALGTHPLMIWGDQWIADIEAWDVVASSRRNVAA